MVGFLNTGWVPGQYLSGLLNAPTPTTPAPYAAMTPQAAQAQPAQAGGVNPLVAFFQNNPSAIAALAAGIGGAPNMRMGLAQAAGQLPQAMASDRQRQELLAKRAALTKYLQNPAVKSAMKPEQLQLLQEWPELAEQYIGETLFPEPADPLKASDLVQVPGPDGKPTWVTANQGVGKPAYEKPTDPTTDTRNYNDYVRDELAAGRTPLSRYQWDISLRKALTPTGQQFTPGQTAVDQKFAEEYVSWVGRGGFADVQKQIGQLGDALKIVEENPGITQTPLNALPGPLQAWLNTEGVIAKERVQEVVQRNLRLILGAQFTQREGEMLMERAFNPDLPTPENARRIRALMTQIEAMARAKQDAVDYFAENGTLIGFKGKIPTIDDAFAPFGGVAAGGAGPATGPNVDELIKKYAP